MHSGYRSVLFLFGYVVLQPLLFASSSSSNSNNNIKVPLHGIRRDPFVEGAPLIVAAVCKDGIAIVAAHTTADLSDDDETILEHEEFGSYNNNNQNLLDPLLYYRPSHSSNEQTETTQSSVTLSQSNKNNDDNNLQQQHNQNSIVNVEDDDVPFLDLPEDYGGPFRISPILSPNNIGSVLTPGPSAALISCGWRADCLSLVDKCNDFVDKEQKQFGTFKYRQQNNNNNYNCKNYKSGFVVYDHYYRLASELSYYMASCAVSDRVRAMSCVSLLATNAILSPPRYNSMHGKSCLWFVDATGAYLVRAHCFGGGALPENVIRMKSFTSSTSSEHQSMDDESSNYVSKSPMMVSDYVNQRLLDEYFTRNFTKSTTKDHENNNGNISNTPHLGFEDLSAVDGLKRLVRILANKHTLESAPVENNLKNTVTRQPSIPLIPPKSRLELAILRNNNEYNGLIRQKLKNLATAQQVEVD